MRVFRLPHQDQRFVQDGSDSRCYHRSRDTAKRNSVKVSAFECLRSIYDGSSQSFGVEERADVPRSLYLAAVCSGHEQILCQIVTGGKKNRIEYAKRWYIEFVKAFAAPEPIVQSVPDMIAGKGRALSAQELAVILHLTPAMVYKEAKDGRLPSFRVGTSVRFDPKLVIEWYRQQ